jgi:hypothetical protein
VGLGIMAMAAALIGRDTWRFGTVAVLAGAVLLAVGGWLNREYLREFFEFRGVARRGEKRSEPRAESHAGAMTAEGKADRPTVVPGLADSPPPRPQSGLRGDREAPIVTAAEGGIRRGKSMSDDTPPDGQPRLRIR